MEYFRQGNSQFVDEDYEEAVESYSAAVKEMPNSATALLNRGTAFLKLKKYQEALEDFNTSITLNDSLELAYFRKGVALFELEMYKTAKASFETGLRLRKQAASKRDPAVYTRFIRKCEAELSDDSAIAPPANETSVRASLVATPVPQVVQPKQALILPVRYQYYQSDATLSISVLAKNLATEDVVVDIQPEHLRVVIKYVTFAGENKEEVVIDKALYASVDVTKSKFVVLKPKVEITLVKIEKEQWGGLEHTGEARLPRPEGTPLPEVQEDGVEMDVDGNAVTATTTLPNKRPKPYASNKDWDKVSSEIAKDLEKEKKEADDGANSVLAELYKGMDPESQRAMQKSFQTSGGTVLSTNWKEVRDTDYESAEHRQAPKGMEWRNWEGDKLKQRED